MKSRARGRVADEDSLILAHGGEQPPVRVVGQRRKTTEVFGDFGRFQPRVGPKFLAVGGVPHPDRPICTGSGEGPAVWAEGYAGNLAGVPDRGIR